MNADFRIAVPQWGTRLGRLVIGCCCFLGIVGITPEARATTYSFTFLTNPTEDPRPVAANGINNSGQIVGSIYNAVGGFLYTGGTYTTIDVPGSVQTNIWGINNRGKVSGDYADNVNGSTYLFTYKNGVNKNIDVPGVSFDQIFGINNRGEIVGTEVPAGGGVQGILYSHGTVTPITDPNVDSADYTIPFGINDKGEIVGYAYGNDGYQGFLDKNGIFSVVSDPGVTVPGDGLIVPTDINDKGQIVGSFGNEGFIETNGVFDFINISNAEDTEIRSINNKGDIVGEADFGGSDEYAFEGVPDVNPVPIPPTLPLFAAIVAGLGVAGRRRRV